MPVFMVVCLISMSMWMLVGMGVFMLVFMLVLMVAFHDGLLVM